mgnify:CR=1 FL=1
MPKLNKIITTLPIIFSVFVLTACGGSDAKQEDKEETVFAIPVTVTNVARNDISSNFHSTATLESRNEADIITRVTGIIEELTIEEGDYVEKGQVLARIDSRRYELALDKAEAELAGLKQELNRLSTMAEKKLVSAQASEKVRYQYESAMAARELAALDVQDSKIIAPISGYISNRYVKQGHFTQGYQKLFHIVDQSSLQAVVHLPEHQLANIRLGQKAALSFSAHRDKVYQAQVRSISPMIDDRSGTFKVILSLDNSNMQLKPGMFAQIALTFDTHTDVITVPSDAIITLDNQSKIFVVKENKAVEVNVRKGFVEENITEIIGEVTDGDLVVVNGQHNLKADALVEVLNAEKGGVEEQVTEGDEQQAAETAIAKNN